MAFFKCKMCGGDLDLRGSQSVATCEYCGTQQTLPRLDDDRRANLYDRANHFRRNNEFDKAMGIYEQILNEDKSDAEAYWSLVLCRYGIEYVEDPATHKRIPTVNRAQFTSVFDDDNYKSALGYADAAQKAVYEAEAKAINEIQKGILAISQKEEPFDVFICYKETDNNGRRTPDSVLANDLYHQLTQEGYKVFFARITLEDKLGTAYEPYIFAALNSAKVMVVLGTKPEYFKAVWVKNEWSRYLSLIKNGAKKILIPAYKDMDPYDLPDEFSHLQAQDMSKLGFMQDLIRGIKKLAAAGETKPAVVKEPVVSTGSANTAPLLERAFMFLEDGDWSSADEYCEKVLDIDPKNANAYLGKLMAELKVKKQEELKNCAEPFDHLNSYQKTLRFSEKSIVEELKADIDFINERNEQQRLEGLYLDAMRKMGEAKNETAYKNAANAFAQISGYRDAEEKRQLCLDIAKECAMKVIYANAVREAKKDTVYALKEAIIRLERIQNWFDANQKITDFENRIKEIKAKEEAERQEAIRQSKRIKKIGLILAAIAAVGIVIWILTANVFIPNSKYNDAVDLMEDGKYNEAIAAFEAMDGYKDSNTKIVECNTAILEGKYNDAVSLMGAGKYDEAITAFEAMDGYKDCNTKIEECNTAILDGKYNDAVAMMNARNIIEAYEAFIALDGYKDSIDKANSIYDEYRMEKLKTAQVGDYVLFGAYEQDNNTSNGKENIEWLVLDVKDGKALAISKYALNCKQYNTILTDVTWEECSLREWLNSDFINAAFSDDEKAVIPMVTVSPDKNPFYNGTNQGKATQDQIFLLSIAEVNKYFTSDTARQCTPTDYAVYNGASIIYGDNCCWWLRTSGDGGENAAGVMSSGEVHSSGPYVVYDIYAVRPGLWIDLSMIDDAEE